MSNDSNLMIMLEHGGPIFHFIIALSVVALGLVIERMIWISRTRTSDELFFEEVLANLDSGGDHEQLRELCLSHSASPLSELVVEGVNNDHLGLLALRRILLDTFNDQVRPRLEQNLGWIATIGRVAPMIGLFGTVYGMMGAFNKMAQAATQAKPQELAGDINIALATTVGGLFVALIAVGFHSVLLHRVKGLEREYLRKLGTLVSSLRKAAEGVAA